ncbi:uncharacterized protein LOC115748491 [Rhodamnia argentea]|uniref:Uncharacterized protein LOC115748491 n=1 Tax=Rhodamnia argentea TaxID=178133 RepID=A0A8B8Q2U5_9MYRT|nr:uncharacterized protein LOC115748491 [Rhodamnia argentea]
MEMNIQVAVLASLFLQVFLIFIAPIRKKYSSSWILTPIWLAYLLADLVVDYALGLISRAQVAGGASDSKGDAYGDVLAFWAPFLLLHLGGPDTITAFALEDNELWRRHLLNLLFQLGAAGYVFYQSFPSSKLAVPTVLMFIGGTIKYIERTHALHLASFSKFRDSVLPPADPGPNYAKLVEGYVTTKILAMVPESKSQLVNVAEEDGKDLDDKEVIKEAFSYFKTFRGLLVDVIFSFQERNGSKQFFMCRTAKDAFRVIEAELNFFYDVLYTKADIVHRQLGYAFRAISIVFIVSALASFYFLSKHGFHENDMRITYTLLLGAIGLEFVALVRLICSDWTIACIATSEEQGRSDQEQKKGHFRSLFIYMGSNFINFLLKFKSERSPFALHILHARWSKSIFQYNFLETQLKKCPNRIEKLLGFLSLKEFVDDWKFKKVEQFSEKLGELIFDKLKRKARWGSTDEICGSRGKWALEHNDSRDKCKKLLRFVCDVDYGKSLLLWHIATELCYNTDESATDPDESATGCCCNTDQSTNDPRKTCKVLSDYMIYLMIKQPGMMSGVAGIGQIRFRDTCAEADRFFEENIFRKRNTSKRNACRILLSVPTEKDPAVVKGDRSKSVLFDACILAKELQKFQHKTWEILSEVWVELLGYAAIHCQPFMHAQQLSKGGELLTLVWLLMVQLGLSEQFQIEDGHLSARAY